MDLSDTIIAKSDQLNAADIAEPIVVTIDRVVKVERNGEPAFDLHLVDYDGRPYKPCKTMRRLILMIWGTEASSWKGRLLRLYRDPSVTYGVKGEGTKEVGGIRINGMSHIKRAVDKTLQTGRNKWTDYHVDPLKTPSAPEPVTLAAVLADLNATLADADAYQARYDNAPVSGFSEQDKQGFADWLAGNRVAQDEIRAIASRGEQ